MIDFETFVRALQDEWGVEEEHSHTDLAAQLAELGIEDTERIRNAIASLARRILEEDPRAGNDPAWAAAVGLGYGFAIGIRAQRATDQH
jgi:hypothetical protein